jgi:hypothetical protein
MVPFSLSVLLLIRAHCQQLWPDYQPGTLRAVPQKEWGSLLCPTYLPTPNNHSYKDCWASRSHRSQFITEHASPGATQRWKSLLGAQLWSSTPHISPQPICALACGKESLCHQVHKCTQDEIEVSETGELLAPLLIHDTFPHRSIMKQDSAFISCQHTR